MNILNPNRCVYVFHLNIHGSKVQIPFALTQNLIKRSFDESLTIKVNCCVTIAGFLSLNVVVFCVNEMLSAQWNGKWDEAILSEAFVLFVVAVSCVDRCCFVWPEEVYFVVWMFF